MASLHQQRGDGIASICDTLNRMTHSILSLEKTFPLMIVNVNVNLTITVVRVIRGTRMKGTTIAMHIEAIQIETTTTTTATTVTNIMVMVEQNNTMTFHDTHPDRTATPIATEETAIAMQNTVAMIVIVMVVTVTETKNHTDETVFIDSTSKLTVSFLQKCAAN